jgi:hypothetical protein
VGGAVGAHQPGAVDGEGDVEVLQADVVHELVVGALQEGAVDGHDGLEPFAGHAGGEGDGVLLGDADVEVALGKALGEGTRPEPSRMAGVMPMRRWSWAAVSHSHSPKSWV